MPVPRVEKSRNHDQGLPEAGSLGAIFTRGFNIAAGINLFIMTAYYMIFMTGTLYVREVYGASLSTAGFSSSVMVVGCIIARFFCGESAFRLWRKEDPGSGHTLVHIEHICLLLGGLPCTSLCSEALDGYLFGHVVELAGYTGLFLSLALLSLAAGVLYWLVHGRKARGAN